MAADWPLTSPYRFASLITHEGIHQALFIRELEDSPVRPGSSGYSPWKKTLRPGRLVWHAFWTFTCQLVMLCESLQLDQRLIARDPSLFSFLADMEARISVCLDSLKLTEVVTPKEFERCTSAFNILTGLIEELLVLPTFRKSRADAGDDVFGEFNNWAIEFMDSHS
ncbi:hypothetical protein ACFWPX_33320 [Nocardia sp. NPDC058518]|uniref:hypothetical protein n=1 Tax=Nocardia sp. NPDC058518 TaxID=3346534 RepID=UPI00364BC5F7